MSRKLRKSSFSLIALLLIVLSACSQNTPENFEVQSDSPTILFAKATSDSTVLITFSEKMTDSVANAENYTFNPKLDISSIKINADDSRLVTLTTSQQTGDSYKVLVKNITTLGGVLVDSTGLSATFKGGGVGGEYSPIVPETTKVIDSSVKDDVVKYSGSLMQLSKESSFATDLSVGDVIVSEPIEGVAPYGFLRKVKNVTSVSGNTLVLLEEASLEEAVQQGEISEEYTLTPADIISSTPGNNVFVEESAEGIGTQGLKDLINIKIDNEVLCDGDGNSSTTDDQLVLNGSIQAGLKPFVDAKIKWFSLRSFEAGIKISESAEVSLSGACTKKFEEEKLIEKINFSTVVFFIGPVPVVVTPSIEIYIGANGELSLKASYKVEQSFDARYGTRWERDAGWKSIDEVNHSFTQTTPSFEGSARVRAYVGAKGGLTFYGAAYVYVYPKVFAEGTASFALPSTEYSYCLHAGLDVDVGARIRIFKKTLGEWDTDLFEIKKEVICDTGSLSERTLTVSVNGKGSVTTPGLTCNQTNSPCRLKVAKGSKLTLTRGPGDFGSWSGDACNSSSATTCVVTLNSNVNISANYKVKLAAKVEVREGDVELYLTKAGTTNEVLIKRYNTDGQTTTLDLASYLSGGNDTIRVRSIVQKYGLWPVKASRRDATVTILVDGKPSSSVSGRCSTCSSADLGSFRINKTTGQVQKF